MEPLDQPESERYEDLISPKEEQQQDDWGEELADWDNEPAEEQGNMPEDEQQG